MLSANHVASWSQSHSFQSKWNIVFDQSPEWISFKPKPGSKAYPCYSCKNIFSSKLTFQDHINRRVNIIKFKCADCTNTLTFYNRCSFLLHTRKHYKSSEGQINLANVDIFLLPLDLAGFSRHESIPFLFDEEEEYLPLGKDVNSQFYNPDNGEMGKQIITVKPSSLTFSYNDGDKNIEMILRQICSNTPLCEFVPKEATRVEMPTPPESSSPVLNGNSSFVDNLIIDENAIKQEVTDDFTMPVISNVESLNEFARCPECSEVQNTAMTTHFLRNNKPLDVTLFCYVCKYMAPSDCSLKAHERIHKEEAPFVCPECGKVFKNTSVLKKHMETVCFHMTKQVRFRCPAHKCGKIFVLSNTFSAHFATHIQSMRQCSVCKALFATQPEFDEHANTHSSCTILQMSQCKVCKDNPTFPDSQFDNHLNWHVKDREVCVYIYTCKECKSSFRSTATYASHKLRCRNDRVRPQFSYVNCQYCSHRIIFRTKDNYKVCTICKQINQHPMLPVNHSPIPPLNHHPEQQLVKKVVCVLCKEEMTPEEKPHHGKVCKYINPIVPVIPTNETETLHGSTNTNDSPTEPDACENVPAKKKRKRSGHSPNSSNKKLETVEMRPEEPKTFDGTYYCKLCDFKDIERKKFHEHVIIHRSLSTAYQCMECGECFVVKPSLVKHLMHYHKIVDIEEYFCNNDCFDKYAIEELNRHHRTPGQHKGLIKENQCNVCLEQFDNSADLDKHFRIHGMAFLLKKIK